MNWNSIANDLDIWNSGGKMKATISLFLNSPGISHALYIIFLAVYGGWNMLSTAALRQEPGPSASQKYELTDYVNKDTILSIVNDARQKAWSDLEISGIMPEWKVGGMAEPACAIRPGEDNPTLVFNKIQFIKQVREAHGLGLKEAKKAVEDMLVQASGLEAFRGVRGKLIEHMPTTFLHITNVHINLDELVSLPINYRPHAYEGERRSRDNSTSDDTFYTVGWYWENVLSFENKRLFRSLDHFRSTSIAVKRRAQYLNHEGAWVYVDDVATEILA